MITINDAVQQLDDILYKAVLDGLDPEMILAKLYANHLTSDEQCDRCHMYGITFGQKLADLINRKI